MATKNPEQLAAEQADQRAQAARDNEAARLNDLHEAQRQTAGGVTVDPGLADPVSAASAVTNATAPGVMTPGSTEAAQLLVSREKLVLPDASRAAAAAAEPQGITCAGCGAVWSAERVGRGASIPCICGRILVVE